MAKKPAAQETGKAMVNWEEQMAKYADKYEEVERNTGSSRPQIGTRGARFSFQDEDLGTELNVIIIGSLIENKHFSSRFDPDNLTPPDCYAFAEDGEEENMKPHHDVEEPYSESCAACPFNEFGSSDTGRGKACKNVRRLAVLFAGDLEDNSVEETPAAFLTLPVTSVGAWGTYVKQLSRQLRRPPFAVITQMTIRPDPKNQFVIGFKLVEQLDDPEDFEALVQRHEAMKEEIRYTYPKPSEVEQRAPRAGGKVQRGGAARHVARAAPAASEAPARPAPRPTPRARR